MKPILSIAALFLLTSTASAESQLSVYGGVQTSPHSIVTGVYDSVTFDFAAGWDGKSFAMPPYYGIRYTRWNDDNLGLSLNFTHSKVYADAETLTDSGFSVLEFTDGINVVTLSAMRRLSNMGNWTPYVGAGVGFAVPHVEVQVSSTAVKTFEYQYGGPAIQLQGGFEREVSENWSIFGEYVFNYVMLDVDLDGPAGSYLKTNIVTNAINIGVSYGF